jgi:hypothetical protein
MEGVNYREGKNLIKVCVQYFTLSECFYFSKLPHSVPKGPLGLVQGKFPGFFTALCAKGPKVGTCPREISLPPSGKLKILFYKKSKPQV